MIAVAYCRISTYKDEQLDSLEAQQKFFMQYAEKNGYTLTKIYADEGKSGTKLKNRTQLLKLLSNAGERAFEFVLIKDVSRLARNTVDFLTSIRKLKALGITVIFVNYDQTSSESSEFMLTMLSAIAQEESANTSKRVKFGKRINAQNGKIPNLIFGYDKIEGDIFNLRINEEQSQTIRDIFHMYVNCNIGAGKIAAELNEKGIRTRRGNNWTQTAVSRILKNEIYIGKVINAKEEVADFLSGERKANPQDKWLVCENAKLRIISDELFEQAGALLQKRAENFAKGSRKSSKYLFSQLIKCESCGSSFRRIADKRKFTEIKWVCSGRNQKGVDFCSNKTALVEKALTESIQRFLAEGVVSFPGIVHFAYNEFYRIYEELLKKNASKKELEAELSKLLKTREKYLEMYEFDIISIAELEDKVRFINENIEKTSASLNLASASTDRVKHLAKASSEIFQTYEGILNHNLIPESIINKALDYINSSANGHFDIYLKQI